MDAIIVAVTGKRALTVALYFGGSTHLKCADMFSRH